MKANNISEQEVAIMATMRDKVTELVKIRLRLQNINKWMAVHPDKHELAAEQLEAAVNALYDAESAIGESHQHLLVSHATSESDGKIA